MNSAQALHLMAAMVAILGALKCGEVAIIGYGVWAGLPWGGFATVMIIATFLLT